MLGDALHVYTALQHMGKLNVGDTILILDGAITWARLAMQLAFLWGAKVKMEAYNFINDSNNSSDDNDIDDKIITIT